jgi:molecular chaperone DnaK
VLAAVAQLRRECREAKEALSADTEVSISVLLPGARGSVRLHRSEFEALIRDRVEETVGALRRAVGSAGLAPEALSTVLLVGGSSRIPLVAQLVSEQLGRPVAVDADPKNAIAKGAALAVTPRAAFTGRVAEVPAPREASWPAREPAAAAVRARRASGAAFGGVDPSATPGWADVPPPRPAPVYAERPALVRDGGLLPDDEIVPPAGPSPARYVAMGAALAVVGILATVFLLPAKPTPDIRLSRALPGVSTATAPPPPPVSAAPVADPAAAQEAAPPARAPSATRPATPTPTPPAPAPTPTATPPPPAPTPVPTPVPTPPPPDPTPVPTPVPTPEPTPEPSPPDPPPPDPTPDPAPPPSP